MITRLHSRFEPYYAAESAAAMAEDVATLVQEKNTDPNDVVFLMGNMPICHTQLGMAQVHFVNALVKYIPVKHFCHAIPADDTVAQRVKNYHDDENKNIKQSAADMLATTEVTPSVFDAMQPLLAINAMRQGLTQHFIDLPHVPYSPVSMINSEYPAKKYIRRFKETGTGLLAKILDTGADMLKERRMPPFIHSFAGMLQRDIQMTGRIDDVMQKKQGAVVVDASLPHLHNYKDYTSSGKFRFSKKMSYPALTDFLTGIGKHVVTVSFLPAIDPTLSDAHAKVQEGLDDFDGLVKAFDENNPPDQLSGTYVAHADLRLVL